MMAASGDNISNISPQSDPFIGQIFSTFENLKSFLQDYGRRTNTLFVKDNCRKLKFEKGVYEYATLVCKQGGRPQKSVSKGMRANLSTIKCGCPVLVKVVSEKCPTGGQFVYRLTKVILEHNHDVSESTFKAYPENRRPILTESVQSLLKCGSVSSLDVRLHVERTQGKTLLQSDVKNLRLSHSQSQQDDNTKVQQFIHSLKESGGDVAYGLDESTGAFQYLVYMSSSMKNLISRYPEVLIMDVTYKTNQYLLLLLTIMCIDQNGAGHPVMHAFVRHEDKTIIGTCLDFLADRYDSSQTSTIFVDKDLSEVAAIKSAMPQVQVSLCCFHTKQAIKRAFQGKGLAAHIVKALQDLFEQQANAITEENYNNFKEELSSLAPPPVVEYLQRNWWNCPQMWTHFLNLDVPQLHVTTTNHLESYHGKIKTILHSKISLSEALELLQKHDLHLLQAATVNTTVEGMKRRYNSKDSDPVISEVYLNVTSFAARLILQQYHIAKTFLYSITNSSNDYYELKSSTETTYQTTLNSCNCKFFINLKLQCRHIFALRKFLNAPLYQNVPFDHKFNRKQPLTFPLSTEGCIQANPIYSTSKTLTLEEKYLHAERLMKEFSGYLSLLGTTAFLTKLEQLQSLLNHWKGNGEAVIVETSSNPTDSSMVEASGSTIETFCNSQDSTTEGAVDTHNINANVDSTLVVEGIQFNEISQGSMVEASGSAVETFSNSQGSTIEEAVDTNNKNANNESTLVIEAIQLNNIFQGSSTEGAEDAHVAGLVVPEATGISFTDAKLVRVKTKGRPKTKQTFTCRKRKARIPIHFSKLHQVDKVRFLLSGAVKNFTDSDSKKVYDIDAIKTFNEMSSCLLDECVDIADVRSFFDDSAYELLLSRMKEKKISGHCVCHTCKRIDDLTLKMVRCDHCLEWFHFECVNIRSNFKSKVWFCQECWSTV